MMMGAVFLGLIATMMAGVLDYTQKLNQGRQSSQDILNEDLVLRKINEILLTSCDEIFAGKVLNSSTQAFSGFDQPSADGTGIWVGQEIQNRMILSDISLTRSRP